VSNVPSLDFWFEFASTYSYPAAMRIAPLAREGGVRVRYRPFLLGPVPSTGLEHLAFQSLCRQGRQYVA